MSTHTHTHKIRNHKAHLLASSFSLDPINMILKKFTIFLSGKGLLSGRQTGGHFSLDEEVDQ